MLRRGFFLWMLVLPALAASEPKGRVTAVDSIGITVADLDRSVAFYTNVLGFETVSEWEGAGEELDHLQGVFGTRLRKARLKLGEEFIELTEYLAPEGRPLPVDSRSNDQWFQHIAIIVSDMDRAYAHLRKNKVRHASSGPQRLPDWNQNASGIRAFYFKDPDGHALEVLWFPQGKGNAKWQQSPANRLFLGIDHTAIVISNTDDSLRFYRERLGLQVAGESENYGTEQEHLNSVFGARLRITAVRASTGPGVEFLEYLAPLDGRPYPRDSKANDLWHWQTRFVTENAPEIAQRLRTNRTSFVSTGVITLPDEKIGFRKSLIVRDPDGHAVEIVEQ